MSPHRLQAAVFALAHCFRLVSQLGGASMLAATGDVTRRQLDTITYICTL